MSGEYPEKASAVFQHRNPEYQTCLRMVFFPLTRPSCSRSLAWPNAYHGPKSHPTKGHPHPKCLRMMILRPKFRLELGAIMLEHLRGKQNLKGIDGRAPPGVEPVA